MKWVLHEDKEKKESARLIDSASIYEDFIELEETNGATESKIVDNYYEIKRRVRNILYAEIPTDKKPEVENVKQ